GGPRRVPRVRGRAFTVGGGRTDRPPPFSCALLHSVLNLATATKPTVLRRGRAEPSANTRPATEAKLCRSRRRRKIGLLITAAARSSPLSCAPRDRGAPARRP